MYDCMFTNRKIMFLYLFRQLLHTHEHCLYANMKVY